MAVNHLDGIRQVSTKFLYIFCIHRVNTPQILVWRFNFIATYLIENWNVQIIYLITIVIMIPPYDEQAGTHIQYYIPCNDSAAVNVARADELLAGLSFVRVG